MAYLDYATLDALDTAYAETFQKRQPYPWINPKGVLTEVGVEKLRATLPSLEIFEKSTGQARRYGQQSHDRFALEYRPGLDLAEPWREFIGELKSNRYLGFLKRMLGCPTKISFHWHYTPNGCSVSPHCDAVHKLGSHIFYLNSDDDWDPMWGGETVILDDEARFSRRSAPAFGDFASAIPSVATGNHSLLFARRGNSWHGVREIKCPKDRMRQVFIVVLNRASLLGRLSHRHSQRRRGYPQARKRGHPAPQSTGRSKRST